MATMNADEDNPRVISSKQPLSREDLDFVDEEETSQAFADRVTRTMGAGFTTLTLALGYRLGLFEVLAKFARPASSQEIADEAGYRERYVREWLCGMVMGRVVEVDRTGTWFFLPIHRRPVLARDGLDLGLVAWEIPLVGQVFDSLLCCFDKEGPIGIDYAMYKNLHKQRDENMKHSSQKLLKLLATVPEISQKLENGITLCDIGCSNGFNTITLAQNFPKSQFTGLEISSDAVAHAQQAANEKGLTNVTFHLQDVCNMPSDWSNKWDCVLSVIVLHDVAYTSLAMREVFRVLKPGGVFWMMEMNVHSNVADNLQNPSATLVYGNSLFHCMPVSLFFEHGEGLGSSWGKEKAFEMLRSTGFTDIHVVSSDGPVYHCLSTKPL